MKKVNRSPRHDFLTVILILSASFTLSVCSSSVQTKTSGKTDENNPCVDSTKIDLNAPCIMVYAPVCGCNNVTYDNECVATRSGVLRWTKGPCK